MTIPSDRLAREIREALQRGNLLEVFQLLRRTGLKDLSAMVDAQRAGTAPQRKAEVPLHGPLPGAVVQALQRGDRIEAIKLLRAHTGVGLKEATEAIDAARIAVTPAARRHLSPGEVPRSGSGTLWIVLLLAALAVYYFYLGG